MELGGYGFEKSELLKVTEEIYSLKSKKQELELTLQSEKFHSKYIPKRKKLAEHEVTFRLLWIVPITILVVAALIILIYFGLQPNIFVGNGILGVIYLFAMLILVFCGYTAFRLWKRQIHMLKLLHYNKDSEKATAFAKKHDLNTFQYDEEVSKSKIEGLEAELVHIEERMSQLEERRKQLIEEKRRGEDFLKEKGILFDDHPNAMKMQGKFTLREDSIAMGDIQELHEFYTKEIHYLNQRLLQLDGEVQKINKQISKIDDDFEVVKKTVLFYVVIYVFLIIIQGAFSGMLGSIFIFICIVMLVVGAFYVEKKCKMPVILYLVEHDHPAIQEYAFCNHFVPVRIKREEVLEKITYTQKNLEDMKKKKEELDF